MLAEIITIGDELLIGQVIDTNSAFIARELNSIGVSVYQITSVQDDRAHILQAFKDAESRADIIVITGGLGPTKDDITKKTIAEYFSDTLVKDASVLRNIEAIWKKYGRQKLLQTNKDQALVLSRATVLMNTIGTAPGMWLEKGKKTFISLPGVPFEMKALMNDEVIPKLQQKFHFPFILHKTLLTYGLGESKLAERIADWEDGLPDFIKLAYLPNIGKVRLRLSAKGKNKLAVENEVNKQIKSLLPLIEDIFYGYEDEQSLEVGLSNQLKKLGKTISIAESCTGGKISEQFTANSGASAFFKGSVVSYATDSKIEVLGISEDLINNYSVVSKEVAEAMASNVRKLFNSDYGISTTGNAGPTKGDSHADVGTVYIAIATQGKVYSEKFKFGNHRAKVINKAANKVMELLQKEILKK